MHLLWIIVIGFVAGLIARNLMPGPNSPSGFVFTTILGVVGAFVATGLGQHFGWYGIDQGAGLIGASLGAVLVLFVYNRLVVNHAVNDHTISSTRTTDQDPRFGPRRYL